MSTLAKALLAIVALSVVAGGVGLVSTSDESPVDRSRPVIIGRVGDVDDDRARRGDDRARGDQPRDDQSRQESPAPEDPAPSPSVVTPKPRELTPGDDLDVPEDGDDTDAGEDGPDDDSSEDDDDDDDAGEGGDD